MNDKKHLIKELKNKIEELREIFDYYIDSYGLPERYSEFNMEEIIRNIDLLDEMEEKHDDEKSDFKKKKLKSEEAEALLDLMYIFILDHLSDIEDEIKSISLKRKNFINIKDKIRKFKKQRKN
ncbi:MAG: hypothetical protein QXF12_01430 [Candidatus Aenigmatarchaeota archaeon]